MAKGLDRRRLSSSTWQWIAKWQDPRGYRGAPGGGADVRYQGLAAGKEMFVGRAGAMKSRGVPAPTEQHEQILMSGSQRKGRAVHRWIARCRPHMSGWTRTPKLSIEREVVSGHAYAILAPETLSEGWCGYDKPTFLSVDGVSDP